MNWELYKKHGSRNPDGYWIDDHELWDIYSGDIKRYKRKKIKAFLWLLIPICGIIGTHITFEEMGLSFL